MAPDVTSEGILKSVREVGGTITEKYIERKGILVREIGIPLY